MKIATSVPDDVFKAGERLARQLKMTRCQLYSDGLAEYLSARPAQPLKKVDEGLRPVMGI